jgi:phage tail-like protein
VGRPLRGGREQGQRAQAHHGGGQAPGGRRPEQQSQVAGTHRVRRHHARARRTHDGFEKWAGKSEHGAFWAEVSLKDFRKDLIIEVYNEAGQLALAYKIYRCWVSEFQALPDLDANANAVAIQTLKLENEGWERDYDVAEPAEPTSGPWCRACADPGS